MATQQLNLIHFNDVYHIEPSEREPVGGVARFKTIVDTLAGGSKPLLVFSGDLFNPSTLSSVTKGKHMVPCINALNVSVAALGNHDFDFGLPTLTKLVRQCNFPWLLANVTGPDNTPLAGSKQTHTLEHQGAKFGFVGLVEKEWLETLPQLPEGIEYLDFVAEGRKWAQALREEGCRVVVAITHMREPNDFLLATEVQGFDLVLGGHDHFYNVSKIGNVTVVKSGTDFKELSNIQLRKVFVSSSPVEGLRSNQSLTQQCGMQMTIPPSGPITCEVIRHEVTSAIAEDPALHAIVADLMKDMDAKMDKVVGTLTVTLDATATNCRTREANVGNWTADIMRLTYSADVGFAVGGGMHVLSGTADRLLRSQVRDIMNLYPFEDPLVVIELLGADLRAALENGVSQWPKQEGRFPQLSGARIVVDPTKPPGERIVEAHVGDKPLDDNKKYKVCTRHYLTLGKDGYEAMTRGRIIVGEEEGMLLSAAARRVLMEMRVLNTWARKQFNVRAAVKILRGTLSKSEPTALVVNPKVEGRIIILGQDSPSQ